MKIAYCLLALTTSLLADLPTGNAQIRARVADADLVITTTERCAGAIHSLTWQGKEFIDSADHGRQLQSALNTDFGSPIHNETYNPTEAGSVIDGAGAKSSSRLLHFITGPNWLQTTSQMAFWLSPGQQSDGHPAKNTTQLSNHLLSKLVSIGQPGLPNVISYQVTFQLPLGEPNHQATFESLTGYMPAEFSKLMKYDAQQDQLLPVDDGPGEQPLPLVFATADSKYAMGIYSPEPKASYGRFTFLREKVVKWNCVFRAKAPPDSPLPTGPYTYQHYVIVGDVPMVKQALAVLMKK